MALGCVACQSAREWPNRRPSRCAIEADSGASLCMTQANRDGRCPAPRGSPRMKRIVNLGRSPLLLALLATQACQAFPIPQATPTPSATTPMPSATVAIATAPPTKTPMLTPTRRVVSGELQTGLFQTHELVVLILFNAETTAEAAEHAIAGDVAPSDLPQLLLVLSGLADSVEWLIPFVTPPDRLQLQWEAA